MDAIIVAILIVAPSLLDLVVQLIIHRRTVNRLQACPYCPHYLDDLDILKEGKLE